MATTAHALAHRSAFRLGAVEVRPATCEVAGTRGRESVEPKVMQVLLALVDADGGTVSRDDLIRRCWDGRVVGDDAINRVILKLRTLSRGIAAGGFEVLTIKKVGYRLVTPTIGVSSPSPELTQGHRAPSLAPLSLPAPGRSCFQHDLKSAERFSPDAPLKGRGEDAKKVSRRALIAGGAVVAAAAGLGLWRSRQPAPDARVDVLLERGRQALRDELPDDAEQGAGFLALAAALDPGRAETWGLLALAHRNRAEYAKPADVSAAVRASEAAARRALAVDHHQGDALTALATIRPFFGDWLGCEDRLNRVLAVAPGNVAAMNHLVLLTQSVGLDRASWDWNEKVLASEPLSPIPQFRRALKHWIFGDVTAADQVIDRALQLWPRHPAVWDARLLIFAFSGRPRAAAAMIEDEAGRPAAFGPAGIEQWRVSLVALDTRAAGDVAAARAKNLELAPRSPGLAFTAIMILSALGETDAAFAIAEGLLLRRGPFVVTLLPGAGQALVNDHRWRRTQPLFTPATAAMRGDPRFAGLCREIGMAEYWRRRGVTPDYARA